MVARGAPAPRIVSVRSWDGVARDLLRADCRWRVHSVFARAFNLVGPDGDLLGIVTPPAGTAPATLVLEPQTSQVALTEPLSPGEVAHVMGPCLMIGDALVLDLSDASIWAPAPIVRTL